MKSRYFFVLSVLLVLLACKANNMFPEKYKGDQIRVGIGGGFAGELNTFIILENGKVFKTTQQDSVPVFVSSLDQKFTDQMFSNYKMLSLADHSFSHPGNRFHFLEYYTSGAKTSQVTWGDPSFTAPQTITSYYSLLMNAIKPSK